MVVLAKPDTRLVYQEPLSVYVFQQTPRLVHGFARIPVGSCIGIAWRFKRIAVF